MFSFLFFALLSKSKGRSPGYVFKSPSLERVTHHASSNSVTKLSKYLEEKRGERSDLLSCISFCVGGGGYGRGLEGLVGFQDLDCNC